MATLVPARVRVRMYQVGFGDCFLVTIEYDGAGGNTRAERHILFDCGSTSGPDDRPVNMADIADLIAEHTHGSLDVLVLTHRHRDHLLGFGARGGGLPDARSQARTAALDRGSDAACNRRRTSG